MQKFYILLIFQYFIPNLRCKVVLNRCCPDDQYLYKGSCISRIVFNSSANIRGQLSDSILIPSRFLIIFEDEANEEYFEYKLITNKPSCFNEKLTEMEVHQIDLRANNSSVLVSSNDGSIEVPVDFKELMFYYLPKEKYCIEHNNEDPIINITICKLKCDTEEPCIRRCCLDYDQLALDNKCVRGHYEGNWNPKRFVRNESILQEITNPIRPTIIYGEPDCLEMEKQNNFTILSNGSVQIFNDILNDWELLEQSDYCLNTIHESEMNRSEYSQAEFPTNILIMCQSQIQNLIIEPDNETETRKKENKNKNQTETDVIVTLNKIFLILSLIVLFITAWTYYIVSDSQNVHATTLLAYVISLFIFYFFLVLAYFIKSSTTSKGFCVFIGVSNHFFCLMAFCWLSCFNFDIWWTFRELLPTIERKKGFKRFKYYVIFSTLVPIIIVSVALGIDSRQRNMIGSEDKNITTTTGIITTSRSITPEHDWIIYPNYGLNTCFLYKNALMAYLYGPLGIFLFGNFVLFIGTTVRMYSLYKKTRIATENSKRGKQLCQLFFKLFLTMGLTWSFELISWWTDGNQSKAKWFWNFFDLANILQAFAIFFIFVCKVNTIRTLESKYWIFRSKFRVANSPLESTGTSTKFSRTTSIDNTSSVNIRLASVSNFEEIDINSTII